MTSHHLHHDGHASARRVTTPSKIVSGWVGSVRVGRVAHPGAETSELVTSGSDPPTGQPRHQPSSLHTPTSLCKLPPAPSSLSWPCLAWLGLAESTVLSLNEAFELVQTLAPSAWLRRHVSFQTISASSSASPPASPSDSYPTLSGDWKTAESDGWIARG